MRNLGLDVLRLIAVVLVLGRHLHTPESYNLLPIIWRTGGWIGVDLFFVLSGFLVSGLIFKEYHRNQKVDLKRFLIRRGFKIYPAFYSLLIFTILIRLSAGDPISPRHLFGEILFLQNYLGGLWNHTWSLAVEEHFYIGLAIFSFFVLRKSLYREGQVNPFSVVPLAFVMIALLCQALRVGNLFFYDDYDLRWFLLGTHIRIDSLMFGVLISYLWHFHNLEHRVANVKTIYFIAAGVVCLSPAFIFPIEENKLIPVFGVVSFYVGSGFLLLAAVRLKSTNYTVLKVCGILGASSYSIYLWHMPLQIWGWTAFKRLSGRGDYFLYFCFYLLGSLIFGWLMSKAIEWPVLRLRDKIYPNRASPIQTENSN